MAETKINANQTNITAADIGALSASNESTATVGQVLTKTATGAEWDDAQGGGGLPDMTGQSGKYLTNNGTTASWSNNPITFTWNSYTYGIVFSTASSGLGIASSMGSPATASSGGIAIGTGATAGGSDGRGVAIGYIPTVTGRNSIGIGSMCQVTADDAIQLGGFYKTNADANTFKVGNDNGNFEMMSADGTIPADRLKNAINKYSTMPTASASNVGWIVQYTGVTDSTYTHGYLYECVSDGATPTPNYSWTAVQVQAGGGSSLPSQTGNAGKFLTTDGTDASWSNKPLVNNNTTSGGWTIAVGPSTTASGSSTIIIGASGDGSNAYACTGIGSLTEFGYGTQFATALGNYLRVTASYAIQLGASGSQVTNSDANTFKVANQNGNFEIMSADGTIPTARLTKVNSTITLTSAGWSSNTQTVNVTGITATGVVLVSPDPTDQADYTSAGILCTAQAAGTLTFTCDTVPSGDIDVNVVML